MSTLTATVPRPSSSASRKVWTLDEFHLLCGLPKFENRRMILVEGEILDMPNPSPPHDIGIGQTDEALRLAFGGDYWIRVQMALVLGQSTDPMPDLSVVPGPRKKYTLHPTTALLVVEVSESSLGYDTREKANLYAAGGISDYWVLDLNNRCLHVFRDAIPDAEEPFGVRYKAHTTHGTGDMVSPLTAPSAKIAVADLLP